MPQPLALSGLQGMKWTGTGFEQETAPLLRATTFRLQGKECRCAVIEHLSKMATIAIYHTKKLFTKRTRAAKTPLLKNFKTQLIAHFLYSRWIDIA